MSVIALLLCTVMFAACASPAPRPNVLVILIDTLRADRLGAYGNRDGLTPFMDRFAGTATVFRNAYASTSWTAPSVASLFTSRYPSQHGVVSVVSKLAADEITLAEALTQSGYRSGAVVANDVVATRVGFEQGFALFRNVEPNAPAVRRQSRDWLDAVRTQASTDPVFLYLQFMDPHWPYAPPQEYIDRFVQPHIDPAAELSKMRRKFNRVLTSQYVSRESTVAPDFTCHEIQLLESLYNADVAALDDQLALLFDDLESRHFLDNTIVVLTADHGEEFYEHGSLLHAYTLYEESIRVPLMVRLPGQTHGRVVDEPISLVDVAPTLLRVLGVRIPHAFEGTAFVDLLAGYWWPSLPERWRRWTTGTRVLAELEGESPRQPQLRLHAVALIEGAQKLLLRSHGEPELYDLSRDPHEERDLAASGFAVAGRLLGQLRALQGTLTASQPNSETVALDAGTLERLRAVGYGLAQAEIEHVQQAGSNPPLHVTATRRDVCGGAVEAKPVAPSAPSVAQAYF